MAAAAAAAAAAAGVLWGRRMAAAVSGSSSKNLRWLPAKTLKRFQCGSKSYSSLISSPQFQEDQHKPPFLLTLHHGADGGMDLDGKYVLRFSAYNNQGTLVKNFSKEVSDHFHQPFMQSCQGLVCLSPGTYHNQPFLICNPTTDEIIPLPPTQERSNAVGFGFAHSTQEFKVVRFFQSVEGFRWERKWKNRCEVFTLGTNRWREVRPPPYEVFRGCAPFLQGSVHFLRRIPFNGGVLDGDYLGSFDIETEEYREGIPLPAYYYSLGDCEGRGIVFDRNFLRLSKLGESLCLTFDFGELKCLLDMWLLKGYNNTEWVKGHTINVSAVYPYPSYCFTGYPVDTMDDDILLSCSDDDGAKVLSYDPRHGVVKVKKDQDFAATFYEESSYPLPNKR